MAAFSRLVVEQPWIKEIDINPLLASDKGLIALDARVVLHAREIGEENLPKPAIRPYPVQYVRPWQMKDGENVLIRTTTAKSRWWRSAKTRRQMSARSSAWGDWLKFVARTRPRWQFS